jgi:hypothetical protein
MVTFKHCIEMEQLYRNLALKEPRNRNSWLAAAEKWHERAGQLLSLIDVEDAPPTSPASVSKQAKRS